MSKIKELKAKYKAIKDEMEKSGKSALKEAFSEFFEKHPEIKGIVWAQYTPYFNDGDACTFSVGDPQFKYDPKKVKDMDQSTKDDFFKYTSEEDYAEDPFADLYEQCYLSTVKYKKKKTKEEQALVDDAQEVLEAFSLDEIFESVFGDHVKVIATRKSFTVEEYEHD